MDNFVDFLLSDDAQAGSFPRETPCYKEKRATQELFWPL